MSLEQWFEVATNIATSVIAIAFITSYIGSKYDGIKRALFFAGGTLSYFLIVTMLDMLIHFEGILGLAYSLILLGYARVALKGSFWDELVASWIWVFIALFSSFSVFAMMRLLTGYDFNNLIETENEMRSELLLVITALKIILSCAILLLLKRKNLFLKRKEGWTMAVVYVALFAIVTGFFSIELYGDNSEFRHVLAIILVIGLLGSVIWNSYYFWKLSSYNEEKFNLELLKSYIDIKKDHMEDLENTYNEMRLLRHDLGAHMSNIYLMLKSGQYEKIAAFIESQYVEMRGCTELRRTTLNQGLNASLLRTAYICGKEKIDFAYMVTAPVERLNEADMGVLFYNLLNNAVEACERVQGLRIIRLSLYQHGSYITCILANSIAESVLNNNPEMVSDKEDKEKHGYGMKSIMRLIDKYHGFYSRTEEPGLFIQKILLYME